MGLIVISILFGVYVSIPNSDVTLKSNNKVTPELHITYINGVSDTTYIYKSISN